MAWCRWHDGTTTDAKWRVVSRRSGAPVHMVISVWAHLMELANQGTNRGTIDNLDPEVIGAALDIETDQVELIVEAMRGKVLDGLRLTGWEKRNPKREREDSSTERVRKHRDHVTPRNANDSHVTPRNTQIDRKKEQTAAPARSPARAREAGADPDPEKLLLAAVEESIDDVIRAANRGMAENPDLGDAFRPIPIGHGNSRQVVADWIASGISAEMAAKVVHEKARACGQKVSSLKYFDGAVREAHEMASSRAAVNGNGDYHDGSPVIQLQPGEVFR